MLAALAVACAPAAAHAAAGELDPEFSGDGKLSLISAGSFVARAVAVQPDGRIVVAGFSCRPDEQSRNGICLNDGDSSFRLARFTADGGLDTEFGDGGLVTTQVGTARSQAFDVVLQPSGKIVVGGVARDGSGDQARDTFALARYHAHGALDGSFGSGGTVLTRVGTGFAAIADLALAPDGRIVAVGQALDAEDRARVAIARYSSDGDLDGSFGPFGAVLAGAAPYNYGLGVALAPDGGILAAGIAGSSADPSGHRVGAVRLTGAGMTDNGFDGDGSAQYGPGSSSSFANAVGGLPDGRWVAAGAATDADGQQVMALLRGRPDGGLDAGWDLDGVALVRSGAGALASDVVLDSSGRAVAFGQAATAEGYLYTLVRLADNGALDTAFGSGGIVATGWVRFPVARASAGALTPDGRIVAAGIGCLEGQGAQCIGGTSVLLLARYLGDARAPPPGAPPGPPGPAADTRPPVARIVGLRRRIRRRTLVRTGVKLRVVLDEEAELAAVLSARAGRRRIVLANRALGFAPGRRTMKLRPRRALPRRARRIRLELRVRDRAGNESTLRRSLLLR